jgi:hypothetical protein
MTTSLRLDRLVGRTVRTANGRRFGRLHDCRVERRGEGLAVGAYVVGAAGLLERLGLGVRLVLGIARPAAYVVRWDQLDLSDPERPRLTCTVDEVQRQ